jgi:hypothetical protein
LLGLEDGIVFELCVACHGFLLLTPQLPTMPEWWTQTWCFKVGVSPKQMEMWSASQRPFLAVGNSAVSL